MRTKFIFIAIFSLLAFSVSAQTYYWVGGGANNNWNTLENWSLVSGDQSAGNRPNTVPTTAHDVVFDVNSGASNFTVNISGVSFCRALTVTADSKLTLLQMTAAITLNIAGSMSINKIMDIKTPNSGTSGLINFSNTAGNYTIHTGGNPLTDISVTFTGNAAWNLDDNFSVIASVTNSGNTVKNLAITNNATVSVLNNSAVTLNNGTLSVAAGCTFNFLNSSITCTTFIANNTVDFATASQGSSIFATSFNSNAASYFDHVTITKIGTTSAVPGVTNGNFKYVRSIVTSRFSTVATDTLFLNPEGMADYSFGTNAATALSTVKNCFRVQPQSCGGWINLNGFNTSAISINMTSASEEVSVTNVNATNFKITGTTAPYTAANSVDNGGNSGLTFSSPVSHTYYWIGGGGNWISVSHWATSSGASASGGLADGCIPTPFDNVIFDTNSGLGTGQTVNITTFAYCDSMTWTAGLDGTAITITLEGLYISGSLLMDSQADVTGDGASYPYPVRFNSSRPNETVQTSGTVFGKNVEFNGTGGWTLADDLNVRNTPWNLLKNLTLTQGTLNTNGKNVTAGNFLSTGSLSRNLNISNSTIQLQYGSSGWNYSGTNATLTATGSQISVYVPQQVGQPTYNPIFFTGIATHVYSDFEIRNGSVAGRFGSAIFNKITNYATGLDFNGTSALTTDSLLLLKDGEYTFAADMNINKLLQTAYQCGGSMSFTSSSATVNRTINMGNTGNPANIGVEVNVHDVSINRVNIRNVNDGIITYPDINGSDDDTTYPSSGWDLSATIPPATYYWIGGAGNWSDMNHWATSSGASASGGIADGCIPSRVDNVVFDENSGFNVSAAASRTVTMDALANCDSMTWRGMSAQTYKPVFTVQSTLNIYGSLELQQNMTITLNTGNIYMRSSRPNETLKTNGVNIGTKSLRFNGTGGWLLLDNLSADNTVDRRDGGIYLEKGNLDFNSKTVVASRFYITATATNVNSSLNMANSTVTLNTSTNIGSYSFFNQSTAFLVSSASTANTSITAIASFKPQPTDTFNIVTVTALCDSVTTARYHKLTIQNGVNGLGAITTDTLIFQPSPNSYKMLSNATITVNEAFIPNGTPCNQTIIQTTAAAQANLRVGMPAVNLAPDTVMVDMLRIRNINAVSDGTDWAYLKLGSLSPNDLSYGGDPSSNLTNWTIAPFTPGVSQGFGTTQIYVCSYPYTLSSKLFLPTQEASFVWRKGNASGEIISDQPVYEAIEDGVIYLQINYSPGNGNCTLSATVDMRNTADTLTWTAAAASPDWNDLNNWINSKGEKYVPTECTMVIIPGSGISIYPDLTPGSTTYDVDYPIAQCGDIYFEFGGEVLRTDSLHYNGAYVEMAINSNQWYMLSAPLRDTYSGDYYVTDHNPHADLDGRGMLVHMMHFDIANYQTHAAKIPYSWNNGFNTNDILIQPGQGFALFANPKNSNYTDQSELTGYPFLFPKNDGFHYYYSILGAITGRGADLDRTNSGRFIYEGKLDAAGQMKLAHSSLAQDTLVLVGNPFMAHLDFDAFAADNTALIYDEYKIAFGETTDGSFGDFVSYKKFGGDFYTSADSLLPRYIAPMQSFIVYSRGASNDSLVADIVNHTAVAPVVTNSPLRSPANSDIRQLFVTATRGKQKSSASLVTTSGASPGYNANEDSRKLFDEKATASVLVYLLSQDGIALDINTTDKLDENTMVRIGIRTSKIGRILLNFSGMEEFANTKIYLHDTVDNLKIDLSEQSEYAYVKFDSNLYTDDRFYLTFEDVTGIKDFNGLKDFQVTSPVPQTIRITSNSGNSLGNLEIIDTQGRTLVKENTVKPAYSYQANAAGVYIVRVNGETKKIIVK